MKLQSFVLLTLLAISSFSAFSQNDTDEAKQFINLTKLNWEEVFYDSCSKDWKEHWTLDGKKATITHSENGMDFMAGPNRKENTSHSVLWTKQSFKGDIRLEYEYTKIDDIEEAVTILYVQATGSGADGYDKDISKWAYKREVPAMNQYFNHMNTYHISYAAFDIGNKENGNDYIRARRYLPEKREGLKGTVLLPDYFKTGLFEKGVLHSLCKKTPNTALFSFLNQLFTKVNSLNSKTSKALSLTLSYQRLEKRQFSCRHYIK